METARQQTTKGDVPSSKIGFAAQAVAGLRAEIPDRLGPDGSGFLGFSKVSAVLARSLAIQTRNGRSWGPIHFDGPVLPPGCSHPGRPIAG
jgi:hypothetical protein